MQYKKLSAMKIFYLFVFLPIIFSKITLAESINKNWSEVEKFGINKTVNFHAWGGSKNINSYISWAKKRVMKLYNIKLKHIKLKDTEQAVKKVLFEKASKIKNGSIDLIWINGENFSTMLENDLLAEKNWIFQLPNSKYINLSNNSSLMYDFGIWTEGREMPWGLSQLIFFYDSKKLDSPPKNVESLKSYILKNPGRISFPQPPDFTGTSFLKQILSELNTKKGALQEKFNFNKHNKIITLLWNWLDIVTPHLWKKGKNYPKNYLSQSQLLANDEIDLGMSFNISFPSSQVSKGNLPSTVRSYISQDGSLANTHYLTIPYNSVNKDAAKLVVNFLISPEAQIKKQDSRIWGDPSILSFESLEKKFQNEFNKLNKSLSDINQKDLEKKLPEPHPSWTKEIERGWINRYGSVN